MLKIYLVFMLALLSSNVRADEFSIIDVRRNITLSDTEIPYKDFYINAGEGSGLKKNLVVTAVRKISIRDASGSQAYGEILVPVGQLKVIALFNKIAVAREYKLLSRDELPMLEQVGIMTGDKIDLQGAFVDNTKPKPRKVSTTNTATPAAAIAVSPSTSSPPMAPASSAAPVAAANSPAAPVAQSPVAAVKPPAPTAPILASAESKGPAPASITPPVPTEPDPQKLEKTADSGNTSE